MTESMPRPFRPAVLLPAPGAERRRRRARVNDAPRDIRLPVRVNEAERAELRRRAQAAGKSVAAFVVDAALADEVAARRSLSHVSAVERLLAGQLRIERLLRIAGGNLNQAVRALHVGGDPDPNEWAELHAELVEVLAAVRAEAGALTRWRAGGAGVAA